MGQAIVVFHEAGNRSIERESMPVARLPGSITQVLTTGAASVATTITSGDGGSQHNIGDGAFVTVFAVGANLWVTSGGNPVAAKPAAGGAAGEGFPVMSGQFATFAVADNDKIAAIEWS